MRKFLMLFMVVCIIFMFGGCGQKFICRRCDKKVSKAYYDFDGKISFCKDCARDYWAPLDYEDYVVKD